MGVNVKRKFSTRFQYSCDFPPGRFHSVVLVEAAILDLVHSSLAIAHSLSVLIIPAWFCGGRHFVLCEFPHDAGPFPFNFHHLSLLLPHSHPYFSSSALLFWYSNYLLFVRVRFLFHS